MTIAWNVPGLPFDAHAVLRKRRGRSPDAATVTASAAPHSDIFIDPGADTELNAESMLNAATLLGVPPDGDFQLSARVSVEFASTYDAGVLLLWIDDRHWGKLCFEFSPDGEPMIVSVVTRGVSDDANAFVVDGANGVAPGLPDRPRLRLPRLARREDVADDPLLRHRRRVHVRRDRLRGAVADR